MSISDQNNVDAREISLEQLGEVAGGIGRSDLIRSDPHGKDKPQPAKPQPVDNSRSGHSGSAHGPART